MLLRQFLSNRITGFVTFNIKKEFITFLSKNSVILFARLNQFVCKDFAPMWREFASLANVPPFLIIRTSCALIFWTCAFGAVV